MPVNQSIPDITTRSRMWRTSEKIWLAVWKDSEGNPITNDAGLIPVMPNYVPEAIAVYHFIRFKPYSDTEYKAEINALNFDAWRDWEPNQCWISEIHTKGVQTKGSSTGEDVHYVIRCIDREDGWKCVFPNVGYAYKESEVTDTLKSFKTSDGTPYIGNLVETTGLGTAGTALNIKASLTKKTILFSGIAGL